MLDSVDYAWLTNCSSPFPVHRASYDAPEVELSKEAAAAAAVETPMSAFTKVPLPRSESQKIPPALMWYTRLFM